MRRLVVPLFALSGCAEALPVAQTACAIVKVADSACMLLTFVGADGKEHTVSCSPEELNARGQRVEISHSMGHPAK